MTAAHRKSFPAQSTVFRAATLASIGLLLGACAKVSPPDLGLGLSEPKPSAMADAGGNDMGRALTYWGQKYAKKPSDKKAALNYAKNLKAAGHSKKAFRVLQQASVLHGNDREIASEYGRLALNHGQTGLANKLLALADDPSKPDWRIVSGRGAALAKLGKYAEAVTMFRRAHKLSPSNPTIMNNLAMANAGAGNLKEAERLLRQAASNPMAKGRVAKNLALVLKLQGRKAEADAITTASIGAGSNALRRAVKPSRNLTTAPKFARSTIR